MKPHKWAAEIHAWADGADIEFSWIGNEDKWVDVNYPKWYNCDCLYRVKPKTITHTITYPEPLTIAPAHSSFIWLVWPHLKTATNTKWVNIDWQNTMLENGMCFATEEAAQACYDSLFGKHV